MPYKDKEKRKENDKKYRKENAEKINKWNRVYRSKHKEKVKAWKKKWSEDNTDRVRLASQVTNATRKVKDKDMTVRRVQMVYEDNIKKYGTLTCVICGSSISFGEDTIEHNVPLSRGGTHDYCNLGIAHMVCNSKKQDKTLEEYEEVHRR